MHREPESVEPDGHVKVAGSVHVVPERVPPSGQAVPAGMVSVQDEPESVYPEGQI